MDWMRAVIILVMKKTRIGDICILNMWGMRNQTLNLGHQLLMLRTNSSSIISLPVVPHHCPPLHLCTIMFRPCHPALAHLTSTVLCPSSHPANSSSITLPLLSTWPHNRQFQKFSINNTTCTSSQWPHRLLYIPLPVQQFYLTQLQLPSIVTSLICQHLNHYTTITPVNKLHHLIPMVSLSHTMQWQGLCPNINLALTPGLVETRGPHPHIQLDHLEDLRDPRHLWRSNWNRCLQKENVGYREEIRPRPESAQVTSLRLIRECLRVWQKKYDRRWMKLMPEVSCIAFNIIVEVVQSLGRCTLMLIVCLWFQLEL